MATEYDATLVLPGDVESVRTRLASALERLGYRIVNEQPLQAKRNSNGWELISMSVLDYAINVMIQLKPTGEGATLARFDYLIHDPVPPFGWRRVIDCEVKAIGALASQISWPTSCPVCSTESNADSRFCRRCGAPIAPPEPAELEVLRITAESRAAYNDIVLAALLILISGLALLGLSVGGNAPMKLMIFLFVVNALGWIPLFMGLRRLRHALNSDDQTSTGERADQVTPARIPALPPKPASVSVTEHTTDLLEKDELRIRSSSRDTA